MSAQTAIGVVVTSQADRETYVGTGRLTKVLIDRRSGIQGASLCLVTMPPGGKTEMHAKGETEIMFVVQGSLRINTPDGSVMLEAGDAGAISPGIMHSHENCARVWTQYLVILTPDGPEQEYVTRSTLEKTRIDK